MVWEIETTNKTNKKCHASNNRSTNLQVFALSEVMIICVLQKTGPHASHQCFHKPVLHVKRVHSSKEDVKVIVHWPAHVSLYRANEDLDVRESESIFCKNEASHQRISSSTKETTLKITDTHEDVNVVGVCVRNAKIPRIVVV